MDGTRLAVSQTYFSNIQLGIIASGGALVVSAHNASWPPVPAIGLWAMRASAIGTDGSQPEADTPAISERGGVVR